MRVIRVVLAIAVLCCTTVVADSMDAKGTASGTVVLYFSGTSASGTFDSSFVLTGNLTLDEVVVGFSASGWARGSGSGDTATLDIDAQATFAATGSTDTGECISVQGGLTLGGLSAGAAGSSGSGIGDFFATVFIGERIYRVQGDAEGSASGDFVVPEDPYSMELAGDGAFDLSGNMTLVSPAAAPEVATPADTENAGADEQADASLIEILPWDASTWPETLLAELLDILTNVVDIPQLDEESPADS
jgi:hypothetical protein